MFEFVKKLGKRLKWNSGRYREITDHQNSLLLSIFGGLLEDALFWENGFLSFSVIAFINVFVLLCAYWEVKFFEFVLKIFIFVILTDAFETWLRYKHRTSFLKQLAARDRTKLYNNIVKTRIWLKKQWSYFIYLRETNHTKAFLLVNITLGITFVLGKCVSGYVLVYLVCMLVLTFRKLAPPLFRIARKIKQNAESDGEIESLIPVVTDKDLKELSFEPETARDERHSLDCWKPEDLPVDDASDSSENSSSIVTNLSMEKLPKDVDTSDSSDDEYIPLVEQKEQLQSTLEIIQPSSTWSDSAFNALRNITGAVSSMYTKENKRQRVASADSSDGFEIIDKNDLL